MFLLLTDLRWVVMISIERIFLIENRSDVLTLACFDEIPLDLGYIS